MTTSVNPPVDVAWAKELWAQYQKSHDLSACRGKTAGIEPQSERIWIGDSLNDVVNQRDADGIDAPLLFERVGYKTYHRKGRAR